jgi:hypothetical protein
LHQLGDPLEQVLTFVDLQLGRPAHRPQHH